MLSERRSAVDTAPESGEPIQPGSAIGRYFVLATLGVGGMGVVFSAYDPTLERKVAIKLLRGDRVLEAASRGRAKLVAEAQAMARLSHPNVVAVHEVAFADGAAFLVMDHIAGPTLRGWLASRARSWREVLALFLGAGEGLAAAHREGIVHRDFKPDNVLIDRDGRARVVDFGLAASVATHVAGSERDALAGTPAYMAPEQLRGEACDARTDQFAFCVALWEALHGDRPFAGATADELRAAIEAGRVRPAVRGTPDWVRAALVRGLAAAPDERWPTLEALLRVLGRDPRVTRRRVAAGAAAVALGAGALWAVWPSSAAVDPCSGAAGRLTGIWDPPRKAAVAAAFAATGLAYADDSWRQVNQQLDDYAGRWAAMSGEACRATRVEGRQSDSLLDLRMACLEQRRSVLGALTSLWARGMDAETLEHSIGAARGLAPLNDCADGRALSERVPLPTDPAHAAQVAAARPKLDAVTALVLGHRWLEARQTITAARAEADATEWPPLRAEAAFAEGELLHKLADPAAESRLLDAVRLGSEARDDRLVARALIALVDAVSVDQQNAARASALLEIADGAVARVGNDDVLRGHLLEARGEVLLTSGKYDAARAQFADARVRYSRALGADSSETQGAVVNLARVAEGAGDYASAIELGHEVLASAIASVGQDHPSTATVLHNLGLASASAGDDTGAAAYYQRALDIERRVLGPDATPTLRTMDNLGEIESFLGHLQQAQSLIEHVLAVRERVLGPEHAGVGLTLAHLAGVRRRQGRYPEALQLLQRALAIQTKVYGAEHPRIAFGLSSIANLYSVQGNHVAALDWARRALELRHKVLGSAHARTLYSRVTVASELAQLQRCAEARPLLAALTVELSKADGVDRTYVGMALAATAACDLASGSAAQAVTGFERALAIVEKARSAASDRGSFRWWLTRALWAAGRHDEALAAGRLAEQELASDGDGAVERAEARAWLVAHGR